MFEIKSTEREMIKKTQAVENRISWLEFEEKRAQLF
jgi:hypothetical protein